MTADEGRQVARRAAEEARGIAGVAGERSAELAHVAREDARQVLGTARERAAEVTEDLVEEGRSLLSDAELQLRHQTKGGAIRLAQGFRQLGEETQALAEGRPEDAPDLVPYVHRATDSLYSVADRMYGIAEDVEERGVTALLDDLESYARRRPGRFLLGAVAIGFGVGRMVKAEKAKKAEAEQRQGRYDDDEYGSRNGHARRPALTTRSTRTTPSRVAR